MHTFRTAVGACSFLPCVLLLNFDAEVFSCLPFALQLELVALSLLLRCSILHTIPFLAFRIHFLELSYFQKTTFVSDFL